MSLAAQLQVENLCFRSAEASSAGGIALSQSSSGSGWSSATATAEQTWPAQLWPSHDALMAQSGSSLGLAPAAQQVAALGQQQAACGAGGSCGGSGSSQPWQLTAQCAAGLQAPYLKSEHTANADWQYGSIGGMGACGRQHADQQQQQRMEQAAAFQQQRQQAPVSADMCDAWQQARLDLAAGHQPGASLAGADEALPFELDASLQSLLEPFDDWPYMMQPSALPSAALPSHPAQGTSAPPAQQLLPAASMHVSGPTYTHPAAPAIPAPANRPSAAADSPRSSSGGISSAPAAAAAAAPAAAQCEGGSGGKAPRRKGGRPRLHHPRSHLSPGHNTGDSSGGDGAQPQQGLVPAAAAGTTAGASGAGAGAEGQPPPQQPEVVSYKKGGRGPKPKYIFSTKEEAADARRERNRKAALESYYKKKEHTARLQAEIDQLQAENTALEQLLKEMNATGLCPLPEASNEGINIWLQLRTGSSGNNSL